MSVDVEFVDTNVIYYAHDRTAGVKRKIARTLLEALDREQRGALSVQVLQEFAATALAKRGSDLAEGDLETAIEDLSDWWVFSPCAADVVEALALRKRHQCSFWDAMIIQAALGVGAGILWSEDLNDRQDYGGVVVRNPFSQPGPPASA